MNRIVKLSLALFALFAVTLGPLKAQDDQKCQEYVSIFYNFAKQKNYVDALPAWRFCFSNCPKSHISIYVYGATTIQYMIENEKDAARKATYIDTLMLIYDRWIENFGTDPTWPKPYILAEKGENLYKYRQANAMDAYGYLKEALDTYGEKNKPTACYTYMKISIDLFKKGKQTADVVVDDYLKAIDIIEKQIAAEADAGKKANIVKVQEAVDMVFANSGAASCENIIKVYTPKFEATPNDVALLKKISTLMVKNHCEDADFFGVVSEAYYLLDPTARGAANLAQFFLKKAEAPENAGNKEKMTEFYNKAADYFLKAAEAETDNMLKADYYFKEAVVMSKLDQYSKARSYAYEALKYRENWGTPYILIATLYASTAGSCGSSSDECGRVERGAVYCAAVDKLIKAKEDPAVAEEAQTLISRYSGMYPKSGDVFFCGKNQEGGSYYIGSCWINETTTLRVIKE